MRRRRRSRPMPSRFQGRQGPTVVRTAPRRVLPRDADRRGGPGRGPGPRPGPPRRSLSSQPRARRRTGEQGNASDGHLRAGDRTCCPTCRRTDTAWSDAPRGRFLVRIRGTTLPRQPADNSKLDASLTSASRRVIRARRLSVVPGPSSEGLARRRSGWRRSAGEPDSPQGRWVAQRVAVDQAEVRRPTDSEASGRGVAEQRSPAPGHGRERDVRFDARLDQRL